MPDRPEPAPAAPQAWPALPLEEWAPTYATLHLWTQVVGKVRLALAPPINHGWQVPFYVTARGLTTSLIPYDERGFQVDFDFLDHELRIDVSSGQRARLPLAPRSVADFHEAFMDALDGLGLHVDIWPEPVEIPDWIAFERDHEHAAYDPEHAERFWRVLLQADRVLERFRSRFTGKCSPVHLFWGALDLAVTRFSGRRAPSHPGGAPNLDDRVMREAYSRECCSAGFWPGGGAITAPAFYSYAYPEPEGFRKGRVRPDEAFYSSEMGEFVLLYDDARAAPDPDAAVLAFLQSAYDAAADLGSWDRELLEEAPPQPAAQREASAPPPAT